MLRNDLIFVSPDHGAIKMHLRSFTGDSSKLEVLIKIKKSFVIYILHHELWSDNDYSQTKFRCNQS